MLNQHKILMSALILGITIALSGPVAAASGLSDLLKILVEKGSLSQSEADTIAKKQTKINTQGKFEIESADGDFSFRFGGRIQADLAFYDNDHTAIKSGGEFRRARLYAGGKLWDDWQFKAQFDFAGDQGAEAKDLYLSYNGFKNTKITLGNHKETFSLESLTSSKYITFMERSMIDDALGTGRRTGLSIHTRFQKMFTAAGGVYIGDRDGNAEGSGKAESDKVSLTGRLSFSPIHTKIAAAHLGIAYAHLQQDDGRYRLRARPESHLSGRLIDTGHLSNVDHFTKLGIEAAGVRGPFSLQSEYIFGTVNRSASEDVAVNGFYVYGTWSPTGHARNYDWKSGAFKQTKVKQAFGQGGLGAMEIALRYSTLDLTDGGIDGGKESNLTVGINWYPNNNVRFSANYVSVLDIEGGANDGAEPSVWQLRGQLYW